MISKELAKKIRYIQIYTSKAVNHLLAGEYESIFKGRGMSFSEVREYQMGDDVRTIDWNVTARTGSPHVKLYVEERELTVLFLVDMSASGGFGSIQRTKNEVAAELCALVAFSAIKNNDKVGLALFTDRVEKFIPPAKGATHVLRIIRELLSFSPERTRTDIKGAIEYLTRITTKRCVVFLISDFFDEGFEKPLRVMGKRHDLIAVSVSDPREMQMPEVGLIELEDAETGRRVVMDTGSRDVRKRYEALGLARLQRVRNLFRSTGVDHLEIDTNRDYVGDLVRFFKIRGRRLRQ
ncbi:MAG: DUF58 domain-containing protein [Desulfobacteraceae bacterium]|nr:MAG: DUF58 domain-containing protein [Desulfobacteraceae bacterium]